MRDPLDRFPFFEVDWTSLGLFGWTNLANAPIYSRMLIAIEYKRAIEFLISLSSYTPSFPFFPRKLAPFSLPVYQSPSLQSTVALRPRPRPLLLLRNPLLPPLHCLPSLPSAHALKSSLQHCPLLFAFFQIPRPFPRQSLHLLLFLQLGERRSFEVNLLLFLQ